MKFQASPWLLSVALCVLALFRPGGAKERVPVLHVQARGQRPWGCALNPFSGWFHLAGWACTFFKSILRISRDAKKVPWLRALDQLPDDEGQADDNSSTGTVCTLAFAEQCPRPTDYLNHTSPTGNSFFRLKNP